MDLYASLGGTEGCRALSAAFYARVKRDPVLRPFFPGKSVHCAVEEFTAFLVQFTGGPAEDAQRRWWVSLAQSHARFEIGVKERDAWLALMIDALEERAVEEPLRRELLGLFERMSARLVAPTPEGDACGRREEALLVFDEAAAAMRTGDVERALSLAEQPELRVFGASMFTGLLAMMVRSRSARLVEYAVGVVTREPGFAGERFAARTLLHDAAAAGCMPMLTCLLKLGMHPDVQDGGRHTPLYSAANECAGEEAGEAIRTLAAAGADVNACAGVQRCTPLHMAARRGNVAAAAALIECGAQVGARDVKGDTPLQRALNCKKSLVAEFLRGRLKSVSDV